MIPPSLAKALDRVRQGADVMPARQLHRQLEKSLGVDWRSRLASFDETPIAAASIGQVRQERFRLWVIFVNVSCMASRGEGNVSTSFNVAPRQERVPLMYTWCMCICMATICIISIIEKLTSSTYNLFALDMVGPTVQTGRVVHVRLKAGKT